jgi:hypothetical protein
VSNAPKPQIAFRIRVTLVGTIAIGPGKITLLARR